MSTSSAESGVRLLRTVADYALPWLCSTTAHIALLILLGLTYEWVREESLPGGTSTKAGLHTVFISSPGEEEKLSGLDDSGLESTPSASAVQDVEPAPPAQELGPVHEGGGADGGAALAALLPEKPVIRLPLANAKRGSALGAGSAEGGGTGAGQGLTTEPKGSNRVHGGYARTGVFGVSGEGYKFVYVFDRSGSMDGHGGAPLAAAKRELVASLKNLGQTHQFQIIFYNEHPRVFSPSGAPGRLVFGTDQNKYLAQKFIGSITADGATRHEEALELAVRMTPDVIFFLTDADEPRLSHKQLAHVAQINRGSVIHAIEFGYGPQSDPQNFLTELARENRGQHVYINVSDLPIPRR